MGLSYNLSRPDQWPEDFRLYPEHGSAGLNGWRVFVAWESDWKSPVRVAYLDLDPRDRAGFQKSYETFASNSGKVRNKERFKKLEGTDLYEFKRFQLRLAGFFLPGKLFVICHIPKPKKRDGWRAQDIDRAEAAKSRFENLIGRKKGS